MTEPRFGRPAAIPADPSPWAAALGESGEAFSAVSSILWRERECLELLQFKLVEQSLVLAAGHTRWLHLCDEEIRLAAESVREAELIRAAEFDLLARQCTMPVDTSLREFAATVPAPWNVVFEEHAQALRALALEIRATSADNMRLLRAGEQAIRETLDQVRGGRSGYTARGTASARNRGAALLDEQA